MTTRDDYLDDDFGPGPVARVLRIAVPVFVFALIAFGVWYLLHSTSGMRREAPRLQTILATLPPPPPPPPKERPPEPEKKIQEVPKPNLKPDDAPKPMTINGPAQAGNDAFNIQAGDGSGNILADNGGLGEATYSRYMGSAIEQMIQQDDRVNRLVFSAEIAVWIDSAGRLTQAKILRSSGDAETDNALIGALKDMPGLDQPPPASLRFPQRIAVKGRRASG